MARVRARGFALITTTICSVAMIGMLGLAVDLGRMYVVKNEMQAYVDSASLAAALELDGTANGLARARNAVATNPNRFNLGSAAFSGTQTDFSTAATGPWEANPSPADGYRFVRVRASGSVALYLMPVLSAGESSTVAAIAVAGQVVKPSFREGLLPFSPFSHSPVGPNFGFIKGERYTLRWPSNPKVGSNLCPGDDADEWVEIAQARSPSERGYIDENSSSVIRQAIVGGYQTRPLATGDSVLMTGGNKQTQRDSLVARINQDTDPVSTTYDAYEAADNGNGRRLVAVAINSGPPDDTVVGFAQFFLLAPSEYDSGGNKPFCAEYVGPYVQGSRHAGAGPPGAYAVRLVE